MHKVAETAIDVAARLRLWDAVALFIMSGKAGTVISSTGHADGESHSAAVATAPKLVKVAAAAAALVDAAGAGRTSVVANLLLEADGTVLAHQISPPPPPLQSSSSSSTAATPSFPITPLHSILTMSRDLQDNVANISSNLTLSLRKLSRTQYANSLQLIVTIYPGSSAASILHSGESLLMCACASGQVDIAKELIVKAAPVFMCDRCHGTLDNLQSSLNIPQGWMDCTTLGCCISQLALCCIVAAVRFDLFFVCLEPLFSPAYLLQQQTQ
jgi:hypothetical protein